MNTYAHGSSENRDDELRRTILHFIGNYMGNDPLEPWLRCIKWLKEMNPPGNAQLVLREVLGLCAETFVPDKRYKSDLRYLKVWIQFADCCTERGFIFPYLEANGIGLEHGLYYEAYAMLLEASREYSKADYVFQVGISRGAQPLERVILMYNNFRSRMNARQRRKMRQAFQEQEQMDLFARLNGGAQRPLADYNHGIEGLPILPSFQNSIKEDPLPDMQDSVGGYCGPEPVYVGSKIYESTTHKAESSFEEERVRHWIQSKAPQLHSATYETPNTSNSLHADPPTRSSDVHRIPDRPGIRMDSTLYEWPGQKEEPLNGYLGGNTNLSQAVSFMPAQPVSAGNVFSSDSFSGEKVSMRPAQEYASLPSAHRSLSMTERSCTNENMAGMEPKASCVERAGELDLTIDTKMVTDDILSMFSEPLCCDNPRPRVLSSSFTKKNVSYMGSQEGSPFIGLTAPMVFSQPVDNSANATIPHNSPSGCIPSDSESRTLNGVADCELITATIQQQINQVTGVGRGVAIRSDVSAHVSWNSGGQVRDRAAALHTREVVNVHKDENLSSCTTSVVEDVAPNQKHMKPAWVSKETRSSSVLVGSPMPPVNEKKRVEKEDSLYDDSNVRSAPRLKRSSWSASAKTTECIYISDDVEEIDNRENKKQRAHLKSTTNEGPGARKSRTPVMERSEVTREQLQLSQNSQAICLTEFKNVAGPDGEAFVQKSALSTIEQKKPGGKIYPWDQALIANFLRDLNPPLSEYKGYFYSSKKYSGKVTLVSLASLKSVVKNKALELGCSKYQLKGCTGRGAFAQVYLAEALNKTGGVSRRVVLKVQKPACPWEFYIYRQLDMRIPSEERCSFGRVQNIHIYADCSFMECDFGQFGTLQDVINAYLAKGQRMDEALCIFYTIEMLHMLENLHKVGLIHGDFKPDNLLIRSSSGNLEPWAPDKPGSWKQQGVCLIDWGRSIDISLFAEGTEFVGDSKTDGFRCTEMLEKKPWTFQVDIYGLCGVAHCLLHGSYMEIDKRSTNGTSQATNRPKAPYKRYWNVSLWQNFFETLLNLSTGRSYDTLNKLRRSFEDYLHSDSGLMKKLRDLLVKQNTMLLTRK